MNRQEQVSLWQILAKTLLQQGMGQDLPAALREAAKVAPDSAARIEELAASLPPEGKLSERLTSQDFSPAVIAMVRAGEDSGMLDLVAEQIAEGLREGALVPLVDEQNVEAAVAWMWRRLSRMLSAGVSLARVLELTSDGVGDGRLREAMRSMIQTVAEGRPLVWALRQYPELFPPDVQKLIEAGQQNNQLDMAAGEVAKAPYVEIGRPDDTQIDLQTIPPSVSGQIVHKYLLQAVKDRASDIHFQPEKDGWLKIRYRVDGVLYEMMPISSQTAPDLIPYLKKLAKLDPSTQGVIQDGRFVADLPEGRAGFMVNVLPTYWGDRIVVRLGSRGAMTPCEFGAIGLTGNRREAVERLCRLPRGLVLLPGPCMCGKTTTMYSMISALNKPDRAIITIEDPVEASFEGISQVQVSSGLTFAQALRTTMRQAPNCLMVGDLRDRESAMLAILAALTGHLVIAGMAADSPASAIRRLIDLGVEPYLLASALGGVITQRLIRRLCPQCRKAADRQTLELPTPEIRQFVRSHEDAALCWPAGCDQCNGLGYYGRTGVFSVIQMDESLRSIISNGSITQASHPALRYNGLGGMLDDALEKAAAGVTSLDEVVRLQLELMV